MSFIKFVWSPMVGILLAYLLNYQNIMGGLPLKIAIIESFYAYRYCQLSIGFFVRFRPRLG